MISQKHRFHGHASLRFVLANGQQARGKSLSIKYTNNPHRHQSRVAIVVSKKVCKHAVDRNRIRRRLYEIIRKQIDEINNKGVFDLAIIVYKADILDKPFNEIEAEVLSCLTKISKDGKM